MEFTVVPWRTDPALGQIRELRYIVNTNAPIGPQTAQVLETQRYVHRKESNTHIIEAICSMREAPYGDCFVVETKIIAQPASGNKTRVDASTALNFTKSCFIQGTIEKASIKQAKDSYADWAKLAEDFAKTPNRTEALEKKKAAAPVVSEKPSDPTMTKSLANILGGIMVLLLILIALVINLISRLQRIEALLDPQKMS
eukprot:TRINITY_DN3934_c0_g1_i2.p1 TRINITY_DN3934_c0_g1~~TRINITY_DN3934_c0_g1_i2.p1  ORF type:complete len:199 (+),score=34.65 TRINITY_DN3934_c0_g1_i2:316-912(+)